jgi:hypothetical protein
VSTPVANSPRQEARLAALRRSGPTGLLAHCTTFALDLRGQLDERAVQAGVDEVVARHEALRARFPPEGGRHWIEPDVRVEVRRRLLLDRDPERRWAEAQRLAVEDTTRPFDVERPPLLRATLLAAGPDRHLLLLSCDQLVIDAWSMAVLVRDLVAAADRAARGLRPDRSGGGAYVRSRAELAGWLAGETGRAAAGRLDAGQGPERRLAVTPAPDAGDLRRLARHDHALPDAVAGALLDRAREHRVPLIAVTLAAFALAAAGWCGDDGPTVRSTFAARETPDEEEAVGWLSNEVLIPLAAPAGTVEARIRGYARAVFAHLSTQRVPRPPAEAGVAMDGLSASVVFLPEELTGEAATDLRLGGATVHPSGVSICPSGADLELYAAQRPLVLDRDDRPALLLGGISQRARVGQAQLEEAVTRWAAAAERLACLDWRQTPWEDITR